MKTCAKCVLSETFPGIRFNDEGVCNYCLEFKGKRDLEARKADYRARFEKLIAEHRGRSGYDALMSYSGGKDSTYTLALLRESYDLNVLAVTLDNGFMPEQTTKNIRLMSERLGFDHILYRPRFDVLKKIFSASMLKDLFPLKTLNRASSICTSCISLVKFFTLRTAVEKSIPLLAFGWSPGQIPMASSILANNPDMVKAYQKVIFEPLHKLVGDAIRPYFLEEAHFQPSCRFPVNVSPLAFFDYDEEKIIEKIKGLGWIAPGKVDANSTNCLLNSLANSVHQERHGFHPYAFEMAKLVREGYLDRQTALEKLNKAEDPATVDAVKKKLSS